MNAFYVGAEPSPVAFLYGVEWARRVSGELVATNSRTGSGRVDVLVYPVGSGAESAREAWAEVRVFGPVDVTIWRIPASSARTTRHGETTRDPSDHMALLELGSLIVLGGRLLKPGQLSGHALGLAESDVSSPYGDRVHPITHERKFHRGLDIPLPQGTPVHPPWLGVVGRVVPVTATGTASVDVFHAAMGPQPMRRTRYVHLSRIDVKPGDVVFPNRVIGLSGGAPGYPGSGPSTTGPHLHLEASILTDSGYQLVDPFPLLPTGWKP